MPPNLNRLLRLGIRRKLVIAFLALSTLPLLFSGLYAIHVHKDSLEHAELEHLEHDVLTVRERTATFLRGVDSDLRFIGQSRLFRSFVADRDPGLRAVLLGQLLDFARGKGIYHRIRYLDWELGEVLNVEVEDGHYAVADPDPAAHLGFYRHLLADAAAGQEVSAAVEVTGHDGRKVAALSHALAVTDAQGRQVGALVLEVYAAYLFRIVEQAHENTGGVVALVNSEGHYLYHSELKQSWGKLLASRDEINLYTDRPGSETRQIMSPEPGVLVTEQEVIAHAPILEIGPDRAGVYTLYMSSPREQVLGPVIRFERAFYALLALFILMSLGLAYFASAHFTHPVKALQEGAEVIAGGQFGRRLQVDTYDEIQKLAETFNAMAQAIEEREERIRHHEAELEDTVTARTAELAAEKAKLQAILDGVPSAFVLLDGDLRVQSASQAFESIFGRSPASVMGSRYDAIGEPGERSAASLALTDGRIHTSVHALDTRDGERPRIIERIAIPVSRGGTVEQVIEILTDITERKDMERRVVQSEKLATTGEMAAVIAHEMRNSLTSVKMILQLELESREVAEEDRQALVVAADAVRRMEVVVTDLLKFARPSPPTLQAQDVNAIIEDGLVFVRHQIDRKDAAAKTRFSKGLPPVPGDADQLKEMFVNLLLNALQAIEVGGRIDVATEAPAAGDRVIVTITDDGPGIPPDHVERIFDPFYTTKLNGTGLGLSTARRTVENHGGKITVVTSYQDGARFRVELPSSAG